MVLADTEAMLRFAAGHPSAQVPVGTIGHCMGRPSTKKSSPANAPGGAWRTKPSAERAWERTFALFERRLRHA